MSEKQGVGNGAKMREALEQIASIPMPPPIHLAQQCAREMREKAIAALAEPRRNCDKYTSLDEARNAYMAINEMPEGNHDEDMRRWLCNFHNWLFAPYESEVKK